MILKKATLNTTPELKQICIEAYTQNFKTHWNKGGLEWYLDKEFSTERLSADLLDTTINYYFIVFNNTSVGFIKTLNNSPSHLNLAHAVTLEKLYILPKYKRKGFGRLAIYTIVQKAVTKGTKHLVLSVIDTNSKAIAFYKKLGFTFHSKTRLELPYFKEDLKGMQRMVKVLRDI